jgi:hypothetical protein
LHLNSQNPRCTFPNLIKLSMTVRAWLLGTANPIPIFPPVRLKIALFTPIKRP